MLSALCKNAERVIPLSSHAVSCNGPVGGNAFYLATCFARWSRWIDRICPRSLPLSIFQSVIFIFAAFAFSFRNHC